MTIYIRPMSEFPYEVNSREKIYFVGASRGDSHRNKQPIPATVMKGHYCVAFETQSQSYAISSWIHKESKGLTNIANFFVGQSDEEKRQLLWYQIQSRTLPKSLARFLDRSRDNDLYLWILNEHSRSTAELIKRFIEWYHQQ